MSRAARRRGAPNVWVSACLAILACAPGCKQVVEYTDELVDPNTGRSLVVTAPANAGAFVGFVSGIPVDIVALPITFTIYRVQENHNELTADPISTMLFPSFVLWRTGTLIATPLDMIEYAVWRAWRPPQTPSPAEQAQIEYDFDEATLSSYPVEVVYPK